MDNFEVHYLADKKEYINACAAWAYGRWGVQYPDGSLERALKKFTESAQKDKIPLTLMVINKTNGLPVAMGSIWEQDGDEWKNFTPWIASVYTLYRYRGLGLAKTIISKLEQEAVKLGFKEIYLHSGSAASFYPKLGYQEIDSVASNETSAGKLVLFRKSL